MKKNYSAHNFAQATHMASLLDSDSRTSSSGVMPLKDILGRKSENGDRLRNSVLLKRE